MAKTTCTTSSSSSKICLVAYIVYLSYVRRLLRGDRLKPLGHMCGVLNINRTTKSAIIIVKAAKEIANIVLPAPRLWPSYIFGPDNAVYSWAIQNHSACLSFIFKLGGDYGKYEYSCNEFIESCIR